MPRYIQWCDCHLNVVVGILFYHRTLTYFEKGSMHLKFDQFGSAKHVNVLLIFYSNSGESKSVKLEVSCTVNKPHHLSMQSDMLKALKRVNLPRQDFNFSQCSLAIGLVLERRYLFDGNFRLRLVVECRTEKRQQKYSRIAAISAN